MRRKIKIVLADDHPIYRDGLKLMLEQEPSFQLVYETDNGYDALEQARRQKAHVVLLDIDMPRMSGVEVARERHRHNDDFEIIFLTMHRDEDLFNEAMDLGVKGYVLKDVASTEIRAAVRAVAGGEPYFSPSLGSLLLKRMSGVEQLRSSRPGFDALTASERRILKLIASDRTNKEIAEELGLSPKTIENHRTNMCAKLGIHGSHALLKFAFANRSKL